MNNPETLNINEAVGREVQVWLRRGKLTQMQVAELLDLTQGTVSAKLRGKSPFALQELLTLAGELGISIGELVGEGILNTKIPSTASSNKGEKKIAPVGFKPTGATYEVVAGAGFEPATFWL